MESDAVRRICYTPIGVIHSPFGSVEGMPIQSAYAADVEGTISIFHEYAGGLKDLARFSHIIAIYHFHLSNRFELEVRPFLDTETHGVFATRAPNRPNPIGISTFAILSVEGNNLHVKGIDVVDGTPLLDIKPFVPEFDNRRPVRIGWMKGRLKGADEKRADNRFV